MEEPIWGRTDHRGRWRSRWAETGSSRKEVPKRTRRAVIAGARRGRRWRSWYETGSRRPRSMSGRDSVLASYQVPSWDCYCSKLFQVVQANKVPWAITQIPWKLLAPDFLGFGFFGFYAQSDILLEDFNLVRITYKIITTWSNEYQLFGTAPSAQAKHVNMKVQALCTLF
jgi:hypothetical protein